MVSSCSLAVNDWSDRLEDGMKSKWQQHQILKNQWAVCGLPRLCRRLCYAPVGDLRYALVQIHRTTTLSIVDRNGLTDYDSGVTEASRERCGSLTMARTSQH